VLHQHLNNVSGVRNFEGKIVGSHRVTVQGEHMYYIVDAFA
jgi:hypothetical protein